MQITLKRIDDAYLMEAQNENGNTIQMDGSPAIGGGNQAMRPMQTVLSALGGCSAIDVISFLKKQRQEPEHIEIDVSAERVEGEVPSLFKTVHVHYRVYGDLEDKKVEKAVKLSMEKYCSVVKILEKTATVKWSYTISASIPA
ncbi:MAG: OsmC family protein [Bacteroidota bacterium]